MEDVYAVIDLKSFYASCECAARGLDIFTTPLVVADKSRTDNSIVMSATPYLKKRYGVPNVCRIKDLPDVPGMIYATPRMRYYIETSAKVVSIFLDFVAEEDLHVYSIDESFLYLTPYLKMHRCTPEQFVAKIQSKIKKELGLLATAGISYNMFMAKICLDNDGKKKPPYRAYWHPEDVETKLWSISPITKIWGISGGISSHLYRLGIRSLKELAHADAKLMKKEFGVMGKQLIDMANGRDASDIHETYVPKERHLSQGQTLMKDYSLAGAELILRELNDELCFRLRSAGMKAGCVSVYCLYSSAAHAPGFSRQCSLDIATDDNECLYQAVLTLFRRFALDLPIRGLSIGFSKLSPYGEQQYGLFESEADIEERRALYKAMDAIQARFGKNAVLRLSSLTEDSTIKMRHQQIGGHNA